MVNVCFYLALLQHLDRPGVSFCSRTTYDDNAITNAVEIYTSARYILMLMLSWISMYLYIFPSMNIIDSIPKFSVVQFISLLLIMILESEILIWRNFSFLSTSVFLGQLM